MFYPTAFGRIDRGPDRLLEHAIDVGFVLAKDDALAAGHGGRVSVGRSSVRGPGSKGLVASALDSSKDATNS